MSYTLQKPRTSLALTLLFDSHSTLLEVRVVNAIVCNTGATGEAMGFSNMEEGWKAIFTTALSFFCSIVLAVIAMCTFSGTHLNPSSVFSFLMSVVVCVFKMRQFVYAVERVMFLRRSN